jgi:hypothetical protein
VKKSITPEHIVCLEDGKKFKSLKRHLRTQYGMTPEQYREKWGLPADYPMVAPNYAKARSELARSMGLGQQRRKAVIPMARGFDSRAFVTSAELIPWCGEDTRHASPCERADGLLGR